MANRKAQPKQLGFTELGVDISVIERTPELCPKYVICLRFMFSQHLQSYQDGHRLLTLHQVSGRIVLRLWKTNLPVALQIPQSVTLF